MRQIGEEWIHLQADAAEEPAQLRNRRIIILVLRQVNLPPCAGEEEPLGMAILPGLKVI